MSYREEIPVDRGLDNTVKILKEGYLYISNRTRQYNRTMFATRLLGGKPFICMAGKEAAEIFYDNEKFKRHGAAPGRVIKTLFGKGGVQTLDGNSHRHRKALFMSMMTKERLSDMSEIVKQEWHKSMQEWESKNKIVLYDESKKVLTRSACIWAGIPLLKEYLDSMTSKLGSMYEAGGAVGPRHIQGLINRQRVEKSMADLIVSIRDGLVQVKEDTPLYQVTFHRDLDGDLLDAHTASIELINILRPIVAISVYVVFCALALHQFPEEAAKLKTANRDGYKRFVQEVRRYYPFFPAAIAQVKKSFLWHGHDFKEDTYVLLDIYGTNHSSDLWEHADKFLPDRFIHWEGHPFDFIPQGGGDYDTGHRCAGEWLTIDVLNTLLKIMVLEMSYGVPKQNLAYSMVKMPSLPKSGFTMTDVQRKSTEDEFFDGTP